MNRTRLWAALALSLSAAVIAVVVLPSAQIVGIALLFGSGVGVGVVGTSLLRMAAPQVSDRSHGRARRTHITQPGTPAKRPTKGRQAVRGAGGRSKERRNGRDNGAGAKSDRAPRRKKKQPAGDTQGTVRWFNERKGFGFITPDDGQEDCFVHRSSIRGAKALQEGARVAFDVGTDENGRRAAQNVSEVGG